MMNFMLSEFILNKRNLRNKHIKEYINWRLSIMDRIKWEEYFMAQSHLLALRSTCQRLSVGATIVKDNRIIAGGYNGSVAGEVHCIDEGCLIEDGHCIRTIHAEMNALLQCAKQGVSTEGATIYVTHFPCLNCTKSIIQAGIKTIYYAEDYHNHEYAMQLLDQSGIEYKKIPFSPEYVAQYLTQG